MEVGEAVLSLHVFDDKFELAEGYFVVLQIGKRALKHATFQTVRSNSLREKYKDKYQSNHFVCWLNRAIYWAQNE